MRTCHTTPNNNQMQSNLKKLAKNVQNPILVSYKKNYKSLEYNDIIVYNEDAHEEVKNIMTSYKKNLQVIGV